MAHQEDTLTTKPTTSSNGESQDKEIVHIMSEKQQNQAEHLILKSMTITGHLVEIFKNRDDQEACILLEALEILPRLESNLSEAFEIMSS